MLATKFHIQYFVIWRRNVRKSTRASVMITYMPVFIWNLAQKEVLSFTQGIVASMELSSTIRQSISRTYYDFELLISTIHASRSSLWTSLFQILRWTCHSQFVITTEKVVYLKHCCCHVYLILSISNVILFPRAKQFTAQKAFNNKKSGQWKSFLLLLCILEMIVALRLRRNGLDNRSPILPFEPPIFLAKLFPDLTIGIQIYGLQSAERNPVRKKA